MRKLVKLGSIVLMISILVSGCGVAQGATVEETETVVEVMEETETASAATEEAETLAAAKEAEALAETEEKLVADDAEKAVDEAETVEDTEEENVTETEGEAEDANEVESEQEKSGEPKGKIVVTPFEEPKTMYATIALNMRRGPSTEYDVVGHLAVAQETVVLGQADTGWYQIMSGGEAAFVSNKYMSETKIEAPAAVTPQPADTAPADMAPQQAAPAQAAVAPAGVIMVGDSRCVQMQAAVGGGGCSWICENSKEYTWFSEKAIPRFDQYVGKGTKVVINMGVNDPEHYKQYAELVNVKAAEWAARGARTYFVSVNPVWENPYTTQEQVDTFNANVPGLLSGVTWIDTSSWLTTNGYRLVDGLHFDDPTSVNIFNLIMGSL